MQRVLIGGALALQLLAAGSTPIAAAAPHLASVAIVWRVAAPSASDAGVQSVEAGLTAADNLSAVLNAVAAHPHAPMTLAFDPQFLLALEQLASGKSALPELVAGQITANDARAQDLLDVLSASVVIDRDLARTQGAKRFEAHATAARLALMGDTAARFSTRDQIDFTAVALLLAMLSNGLDREQAAMLERDTLNARDLLAIGDALARAARDVLAKMKSLAAAGDIELAALPAYEPILPLITDAAGKTRQSPFMVDLAARTDAIAAIEAGTRQVTAVDGDAAPGMYSPHGAYDDETAALLQERHPAYAVFSDRVVAATTGGSAEAVSAAKAAAFHGYLLETSRTTKLPIFFSSDAQSTVLDALPATLPSAALGDRVRDMAASALAANAGADATLLLLNLDMNAPVLRRADRNQMLSHLSALLAAGGSTQAITVREFLRRHPPAAETYGFAAASDAGGFDLWMGSANQASLWTALASARKAAGGDAAVTRASVRQQLLRAEAERWFMALALPQPRAAAERTLTQFRSAIAQIYHAAEVPVPAQIAPVKWQPPATLASPAPGRT